MSVLLANGAVDLQALRLRLYDMLGLCFAAVSPAPACLPILQLTKMVSSQSGHYRCRGRIRGTGFDGTRFAAQEIQAVGDRTAAVSTAS